MAEFLIYNSQPWHTTISQTEKDKWTANQEFSRITLAYEKGDIIERFDNGKLGPHAHAKGKFKIIRVPKLKNGEKYTHVYKTFLTKEFLLKKRRHRLNLPSQYDNMLNIELTVDDFLSYIINKGAV